MPWSRGCSSTARMRTCCASCRLTSRPRGRSTAQLRFSSAFSSSRPNVATVSEWDDRYRAGQYAADTTIPLVLEFTQALTPGIALDLACGPGRNAIYLVQRGWSVTAVDASSIAIDLLRRSNPSIDAHLADLESGEFIIAPESYDLVLSCY